MSPLADELDDYPPTIYDPFPDIIFPPEEPHVHSHNPIDAVLNQIALAVAALHRAGPHYKQKSSAFLFFARGSWTRARYLQEVRQAGLRLPKQVCAEQDVVFAEGMIGEALVVLKREGLHGDVADLEWAVRQFRAGGFPL